jgi:hypothetical protein
MLTDTNIWPVNTVQYAICPKFSIAPSISVLLRPSQDRLDHLVPELRRFGKSRLKVLLNLLKLLAISIKVAEIDARAPVSSSKGKFEVVSAERVVVDSGFDCFFEERGVAEEVLSDAEPHARGLGMSVNMVMCKGCAERTGVEQIMWS